MSAFDKAEWAIVGASVAIFLAATLHAVAGCSELREMKREAVKRGHAEWVVDQETGRTEWRWKQ